MRKTIIYYSFIITLIMVAVGFISAQNTPQLISSIFFFPLALYFSLLVFPQRKKAIDLINVKIRPQKASVVKKEEAVVEEGEVEKIDIDRRAFLKIIGSAGMSLFMLALFTKKAEAAFFGSVPGPGTVGIKNASGQLINPAEKQPTDGYKISRIDDGTPAYYGFTNKDGEWFIMKEDSSGNYTYAVGSTDFASNWTNRASLSYGEYFEKF
ncbi:MAG: hypothetical protein KatS3mg088_765 [Patescibacteria group bacterium]|nr:MAG: hypothetical protein KatS3mg088_765 [Patescibacteria group bacterium]